MLFILILMLSLLAMYSWEVSVRATLTVLVAVLGGFIVSGLLVPYVGGSWVLSLHVVAIGVLAGIVGRRYGHLAARMGTIRPWYRVAATLVVIGCVVAQLTLVHVAYTGPVTTITETTYRADDTYLYPLFSDEWVTLAIARNVLERDATFATQPFTGAPYVNILTFFHAFVVGVLSSSMLALPTAYVLVAITTGVLMVLMIGLLLIALRTPFWFVLVGISLVPFVVNASNLPMLWYLLPWNISFVLLLACMAACIASTSWWLRTASATLALAVYPPMLVFIIPIYIVWSVLEVRTTGVSHRRWLYVWGGIATGGIISVIALIAAGVPIRAGGAEVWSLLVRPRGESPLFTPPFFLWQVLPLATIPLLVYSFFMQERTLWYVRASVVVGLIGWAIMPLLSVTVIIDYYRIVAITALLLMPLATVAAVPVWRRLYAYLPHRWQVPIGRVAAGAFLVTVLVLVPSYAAQERWRAFAVSVPAPGGGVITTMPAAPVNRYLHPDDLALFADLHNERFLSPGWKGLVLGALTDNVPLYTKASTITMRLASYDAFMQGDCAFKRKVVQQTRMTYVYGDKVNCPGFLVVGESAEGLFLTRVVAE